MNRISLLAAAMGVLLVGCSDLATKDAPIEDLSKAQAGVATKDAAAGGATGGAAGGTAAGGAGQTAATTAAGKQGGAAAGASSGKTDPGVQTHGTTTDGVEVRPLPSGATDGQGGGAAIAGTAMAGGTAQYAGMRTPPKDVAGPLSKRVIYFDYDSSLIKDEYRDVIQAHAEFLKVSKEAKSILQGHTDERGSRDYNLALGQRRAESVQEALVLLGVDAAKLESVSLGEEKPVNEGHDDAAWSQNRRVEIYYQGE